MRTTTILALLILALPASAEHHRGHALAFLEEAAAANDLAYERVQQAEETVYCGMGACAQALGRLATVRTLVESLAGVLEGIREELEEGDLDVARRLTNQPHTNVTPLSGLRRTQLIDYRLAQALKSNLEPHGVVAQIVTANGLTWRSLDRVLWHVNDARDEEL